MVETADVVVIGAGSTGTSTAWQLARRGAGRVVVVDRTHVAGGPTGRSSGIVRLHYSNEFTIKMALESWRVFERFDEIVGGDCGFRRVGVLTLGGPGEETGLRGAVALQRRLGVTTELLSPDDIRALLPGAYVDDLRVAAYEPLSGYADGYRTAGSYAAAARDLGVELRLNTRVTGFDVAGGRLRAVLTERGPIETPLALAAVGPWGAEVGHMVGIDVPVWACRTHGAFFERPPALAPDHPVILDLPNLSYLRPEGGGLTLGGSIDPAEADDRVPPEYEANDVPMDDVTLDAERLAARLPAFAEGRFRSGYCAVYDVTPDWHPILDRVPGAEGLFLATGMSGHGFKMCPALGEMLTDLLLQGRCERFDLTPFRLDRFALGHTVGTSYRQSIIA